MTVVLVNGLCVHVILVDGFCMDLILVTVLCVHVILVNGSCSACGFTEWIVYVRGFIGRTVCGCQF